MESTLVRKKIILLACSTLTVMAGAILAPSLPLVEKQLANSEFELTLVKLIVTLPGLFIAITAPFAGSIADKFGRKRLLLMGLLIYAVSGTSGLYLNDLYVILLGRAFLGLSVAAVMTASTTLIGDYLSGQQRQKFLGIQAAFMALGGVIFVTGGGLLADVHWRLPFAVYGIAAILLPLSYGIITEPAYQNNSPSKPDFDVESNTHKPTVWVIYAFALLGMMTFYMVPLQIPFLLQKDLEVNNALTGLAIACSTGFGALASFSYGMLKAKLSYASLYTLSFVLLSAGLFGVYLSNDYASYLISLGITGLGSGFLMPNSSNWIIALAPLHARGKLVGGLTAAIFTGQFLSPIAFAPVIDAIGLHGSFVAGASLLVACSIIAFGLGRSSLLKSPHSNATN